MKRLFAIAAGIFVLSVRLTAQAPTGSIIGTVFDKSGAVIPAASISVTDRTTGNRRTAVADSAGAFGVSALRAGEHEVRIEAKGFRTVVRDATVETGTSTTVDATLEVGQTSDVVQVDAASAQVATDAFKVDGVISRQQIQDLPLNGRNFLQLAFLEPGVSVSQGRIAQYNSLLNVSVLGGSSSMASISVDGGNIRNAIEGNSGMNFSQEVVQEFQLSSVNFDLSTGFSATGAINIVTRSGGNDFHGSGYFFFRDHNMSAYPALVRNPIAPDPFFARRQSGFWVGGPVVKNKLFFFYNLEYLNQDSVVTVQPNSVYFANQTGNYSSPYTGLQQSPRVDWRLNDQHTLFFRFSYDGNSAFGPVGGGARLPSNWLRNRNKAYQGIVGWTAAFTPNLVSDFRAVYHYWSNRNLFPTDAECPGCLGLGLPETQIAGTNITLGNTQNATQGRNLRRGNITENLTWQRGSHRLRFGGEIELNDGTGFWGFADPASGGVFGPEILASNGIPPSVYGIPSQIVTNADLLRLPMATYSMGIGNPSQPPPYNLAIARRSDRYRWYIQDAWRVNARLTLNYGIGWQMEKTLANHDLDKPAFLRPVLDDIRPTDRDRNNFSPSVGFAWNVNGNNKTVIRGGFGIYYDSRELSQRLQERTVIGPLGNGRLPVPSSTVPSPIAVPPLAGGAIPGVAIGTPLNFASFPTSFTFGHFMGILPQARAFLERAVGGTGTDLSVRVINVTKAGADLIPAYYPASYSTHFNIGIQHEVRKDLVLTADFVNRQFLRQEIGSLDINGYNSARGPVIPRCTGGQAQNPAANCSTGSITIRQPVGRTNYKALLLRADKRFADRYQFLVSYALTHQMGMNGINNLNNWFETWGPQGSLHRLSASGIVDLPWKFQVSAILSAASKGPLMPTISSLDLSGSGVSNSALPNVLYNGFNRGLGTDDLVRAVDSFNTNYAGKLTPRNQLIPTLRLPQNYELGDDFHALDVRVSKFFDFKERYRVTICAEMFNLFNVANLGDYSFDLRNTVAFGQPTSRASQVFGTGGPRALQLFARFTF